MGASRGSAMMPREPTPPGWTWRRLLTLIDKLEHGHRPTPGAWAAMAREWRALPTNKWAWLSKQLLGIFPEEFVDRLLPLKEVKA